MIDHVLELEMKDGRSEDVECCRRAPLQPFLADLDLMKLVHGVRCLEVLPLPNLRAIVPLRRQV